jgi:riboflavin synthase
MICLTVVALTDTSYTVTAIDETIKKRTWELETGDSVNLERAMKMGDRLDNHMVQNHVERSWNLHIVAKKLVETGFIYF